MNKGGRYQVANWSIPHKPVLGFSYPFQGPPVPSIHPGASSKPATAIRIHNECLSQTSKRWLFGLDTYSCPTPLTHDSSFLTAEHQPFKDKSDLFKDGCLFSSGKQPPQLRSNGTQQYIEVPSMSLGYQTRPSILCLSGRQQCRNTRHPNVCKELVASVTSMPLRAGSVGPTKALIWSYIKAWPPSAVCLNIPKQGST